MLNATFYSGLLWCFLIVAIFKSNIEMIKIAVVMFGLMLVNLLIAGIYSDSEDMVNKYVAVFSNILMLPLNILVIIIAFIIDIFEIIYRFGKGGEKYYDE